MDNAYQRRTSIASTDNPTTVHVFYFNQIIIQAIERAKDKKKISRM